MADFDISNLLSQSGLFGATLPPGTFTADQQKAIQTQSLLALAGGLMEAGGPSPVQVSLGQAIGHGAKSAAQAAGAAQDQAIKAKYMAAQGNAMDAQAAAQKIGLAQQLGRYNYFAARQGMPTISMDQLTTNAASAPVGGGLLGAASGGGATAAPASGAQAPQVQQSSAPQAPAIAQQGLQFLDAVDQGAAPGNPQAWGMLASKYNDLATAMGDANLKARAETYTKLATEGRNGFVHANPLDWNSPLVAIGEKAPDYISQKAYAENVPKNAAEAMYAGQIARAREGAKWSAPIVVSPGGAVFGGGGGGYAPGPVGVSAPGGAVAPSGSAPATVPKVVLPSDALKPAGAAFVNPNSPALISLSPDGTRSEFNKETGKLLASRMNALQDEGVKAADAIRQMQELRGALANLPTGPGTEHAVDVTATFAKSGLDVRPYLPKGWDTDPVNAQIAQKNVKELAMALARSNFPGGRITNADLEMAVRATPNLMNLPGANKELLDNIENVQRLKVEQAQFIRNWSRKNGGELTYDAYDDWAKHVAGMKNIPDSIKNGFTSFSDQASGAPNSGASMNLPHGAINFAKGKDGHTIFLMPKQGGGYAWPDDKGNEVK